MSTLLRVLVGIVAVLSASLALADPTLTVTSPTEGAFIGTNNQLKFIVHGATLEVTVHATIVGPTGGTTNVEQRFTPNASGDIDNSLPLNFSPSSPEGNYTITVSATHPGFTIPDTVIHVVLDVTKPKILEFNPINNSFVKGPTVPITVKVNETNIKEWKVQVNGQDIPNNSGTTVDSNGRFTVAWDVSGILTDGTQSVSITIKDKADNVSTQNASVTVDRIKPSITIQFPRSDSNIRPGSTISVVIDVQDASTSSVDVTGLDVTLTTIAGQFITRVPRISFSGSGGNTLRWTGRIRGRDIKLPKQFKVVANAIDKAGNVAVTQSTTVTLK
jgi:hypothetical protein